MKSDLGHRSYQAGLAAEDIVARHYVSKGFALERKRYRTPAGEIDLIFRTSDEVVFVEVKKSKTHGLAAEKVSSKQLERIFNAASLFLSDCPEGQDTASRFDVALVDGAGRVECLENVCLV